MKKLILIPFVALVLSTFTSAVAGDGASEDAWWGCQCDTNSRQWHGEVKARTKDGAIGAAEKVCQREKKDWCGNCECAK